MTVEKLKAMAVDAFPSSKRRKPVYDGFVKVLDRLRVDGVEAEIWVNGSFLTKKIDPADSDILVVMQASFYDQARGALKATIEWAAGPLEPSLLCHSQVLVRYPAGHPQHSESNWMDGYWLRQFGFSRKDDPKGIAVIRTP